MNKFFWTLILFLFPTLIAAQTNSGNNRPTPEETNQAGSGESHNEPNVTIADEKTHPNDNESPFSLYKDTYLLAGYSDSALNKELIFKFQISAKFRMPLPGLYIAYTQRSFMDVLATSAPFVDHNFEPEVYYVYSFSDKFTKRNWLRSFQFGYRHGSNGLNGLSSRSWERMYLEAEFKKKGFYVRPTIWLPFYKDNPNNNIEDYWGYGELTVAYVWDNDIRISGKGHMGTDWPKGNIKVDLTVPFRVFFENLAPGWKQSNLWFQAWQGYGETFLGFQEASTALAVGVGFRPDFDKD